MNPIHDRCKRCGKPIDFPERSVSLARVEDKPGELLCLDCFNREMGPSVGVDILPSQFPCIQLADVDGKTHRFEFAVRVYPGGISIESWEPESDTGYRFQVLGDPADCEGLYKEIVARMRKALRRKHLEVTSNGDMIKGTRVRGRIEWDPEEGEYGRIPLLIIDGKAYKWEEFGKMLSAYEGFQFKFDIVDRSEDL